MRNEYAIGYAIGLRIAPLPCGRRHIVKAVSNQKTNESLKLGDRFLR